MRTEARIFIIPAAFFIVSGVAYGIFTDFSEWVGLTAILLTFAMFVMVGVYFTMLARRHGARPEDSEDGEIADHAGEQGVFAPWSWWPLVCALGAALAFVALAVGWWIMVPAGVVGTIGLIGWVMEYSTGQHAH
ncbi:cytochrome c oxidase subunit 4 [Demequina pelophila]|uniref:cytochrome c oxidase subunit 4 n=1 Tax=Demequina pelophila TaxID=1638984 RepID=UPI000784AB18|nr:cytochrome c oxidase subunit 4 [Demequina pelophila]